MQQINRVRLIPKWDFNKVVKQLYWNDTLAWVFSVNVLYIFSIAFPKNTSKGLFLKFLKLIKPRHDAKINLHLSIDVRSNIFPCKKFT